VFLLRRLVSTKARLFGMITASKEEEKYLPLKMGEYGKE